ncbi:MAG: NrtA/SsuA/CpmA family ABC transporter substrate-binding protein [Alphaproteobacteria bacterium]|nr:NrtA/SsuA/CpmA family ABC transporter substrate-binding protein [Alphaproteobacteria bacterium]
MSMLTRRAALAAGLALIAARPSLAQTAPKSIRVTYVTAPFNVPTIVARKRGILDKAFQAQGIQVEYPEITSGAQQIQAIAAGAVDIASVLGGASAILGRVNGVPVKVVGAFSRSPKAFAIMTMANGPADIEGLKGKRVGGPVGTTLNQTLAAALVSKGLKLDDVQYINMDLPAARAALLAGSIDAATLAGNHMFAVENAGGRVIATADGLLVPTSVIAVREAFLQQYPELVDRYLAANGESLAFLKQETDQALQIAADEQKISMAEARRMLPWYDFSPRITEADVANLEADQRFMLDNKMIPRAIDLKRELIHPMAFAG